MVESFPGHDWPCSCTNLTIGQDARYWYLNILIARISHAFTHWTSIALQMLVPSPSHSLHRDVYFRNGWDTVVHLHKDRRLICLSGAEHHFQFVWMGLGSKSLRSSWAITLNVYDDADASPLTNFHVTSIHSDSRANLVIFSASSGYTLYIDSRKEN